MESIFNQVFKYIHTSEPVPFDVVPEPLMKDFLAFMEGRAYIKRKGRPMVQPYDFKEWLHKLNTVGVDYKIDLKEYEL